MQRQIVLAAIFCILHRTHGDAEVTKNVTSNSGPSGPKVKRGIINDYGRQIFVEQMPRENVQPKPQFHFGSIQAYNSKYFAPQEIQYPHNSDKVVYQQLNGFPQDSYGNRFKPTPHNIPQNAFQHNPYQNYNFQIYPHQNNPQHNGPVQNSPVQNGPYQNSPYQSSPYQQHYINLQDRPDYVIQKSPFSAPQQYFQAPMKQVHQQRAPTMMVQTSQAAPGNHVRTEIISQTIVNTPRPLVHTYNANNNFPLHMISENIQPDSDKEIPNDMPLITHHHSQPKQHIVYQYSTLPVNKPAPPHTASPIAKTPEQSKAIEPQYYQPQSFPNPIVPQIQHFLPQPFPFSLIHNTVPQERASKPIHSAQNEGTPHETMRTVQHDSPKVVSYESSRSSPHESARNVPHDSDRNVQHDGGRKAPHDSSRNEPRDSPRNVPYRPYESSRGVPYENTKNTPHDSSANVPYENNSKFQIIEGPKEERHEMREKIKGEMFHEEDNDEETFEKAYKASAKGFPAYYKHENAKSARNFGFTPYEGAYGIDFDHTSHHADAKGPRENAPTPYDSYESEYKNPYYSEYEKYKPVPYHAHDDAKNTKSHKTISSEYKKSPRKQSRYRHEDKDSGKPNQHLEKHNVAGYSRTYSDSYTNKDPSSRSSKYQKFVEPKYQYGFEPIVADKSSTSPVWEDSEHAPNNMKKIYKENWYISKMSTSGAA